MIVVIPAHNEAATIGTLVRAVKRAGCYCVVADDGSTDNTAHEALIAGAYLHHVPSTRHGLCGVYVSGLRCALELGGPDTDYLEMDAGGSHDPGSIVDFAVALRDADVACGRRFGGEGAKYLGTWQRKTLSYVGTQVTNLLHRTHFKDATSGFIAYRGEALHAILREPWHSAGHFYQTEMRLRAHRLGLKMVEVPITYRNSSSSLNLKSIAEAARLVLRK